jgi:hypothetical protein
MKRVVVWTLLLTTGFTIGFRTARSSLLTEVELPSREVLDQMRQQREASQALQIQKLRTVIEFLQKQLDEAAAKDRMERSAESRQRLQEWTLKVRAAERSLAERQR